LHEHPDVVLGVALAEMHVKQVFALLHVAHSLLQARQEFEEVSEPEL
jgi:hypothetical protein